jgi:hypothetical protein
MNEDLERRLQGRLHDELPPAPAATRAFLERLPMDHPRIAGRSGAGRAAVMAVVGIGLLALASMAGLGGSPEPSDDAVAPPTTVLPSPTGSPPTSSTAPTATSDALEGLTIYSVRELMDLRAAGRIGGERVALRGLLFDRTSMQTCVVSLPPATPQTRCHDGELGIYDRGEPLGILTLARTPFVDEAGANPLFPPTYPNGQPPDPAVSIVVVGHFDDPRAEDCQPEFRQLCRERFVLEQIVESHPEAVPTPGITPPPTLAGLTIHTVSGLLDLRSAGRIHGERVALRGFWSDRNIGGSCVLPDSPPGELEIQCVAEFGITERNEPFGTVTRPGGGIRFEPTDGPALTPFVEGALADRLFSLPHINGQYYPPVPIVVVGHFDDPRAEDCRARFRQRCRDRLVLDEIVEFLPNAVPTPGVTPSPSPFPFDDPPPPPFTNVDCFGDIPYSFTGWGSGSEYGIDLPNGGVVFIMVTRDEVRRSGTVARWVCWAHEGATVFHQNPLP